LKESEEGDVDKIVEGDENQNPDGVSSPGRFINESSRKK
jgi:hypothetical protein